MHALGMRVLFETTPTSVVKKNMKETKRKKCVGNPFTIKKTPKKRSKRRNRCKKCDQDVLDEQFLSLNPKSLIRPPPMKSVSCSSGGEADTVRPKGVLPCPVGPKTLPLCPVQEAIEDIIEQTKRTDLSRTDLSNAVSL